MTSVEWVESMKPNKINIEGLRLMLECGYKGGPSKYMMARYSAFKEWSTDSDELFIVSKICEEIEREAKMTNQVKLHVGYVGRTRAGERVEIVSDNGRDHWKYIGDGCSTYTSSGSSAYNGKPVSYDIIGPWEEPAPTPDYNDGLWHGWNGGECPVHGETVVECFWTDHRIDHKTKGPARDFVWSISDYMTIAFRVTKPYVEPVKPREFWVCYYGDRKNDVLSAPPAGGEGGFYRKVIHVREVM